MKLETILEMWETDSVIDKTELGQESLNTPRVHARYLKILAAEKLQYRRLHAEMQVLKRDKFSFLLGGATAESQEKGWEYPTRGRIMKSDIDIFNDADKEVQALQQKMDLQQQKIETLDSILRTIGNRGFQIKNAIDWYNFQNGR
jgi:hypothetical protein